jgi:hypothetical protein
MAVGNGEKVQAGGLSGKKFGNEKLLGLGPRGCVLVNPSPLNVPITSKERRFS